MNDNLLRDILLRLAKLEESIDRLAKPEVPLGSSVRPLFRASNNTTRTDVTGDGTAYSMIYEEEIFDVGSNYDASTGIYTAPYDGRHLFALYVRLAGILSTHTSMTVTLVGTARNTVVFRGNAYNVATASGLLTLGGVAILDMTAGNTAYVSVTVSGGTKVVDVSAAVTENVFAGYLLP